MTDKQQATLEFIRAYIRENGMAPTNKEITVGMGWASANNAQSHLQALQRKGWLTNKEITVGMGWASANNAQSHLQALQRKGWLKIRRGVSRGIVLTGSAIVDIPDVNSGEYWFDGVFQHLRYERDVYKVIEAAGLKGRSKSCSLTKA
ncbi:LexA family transcriptional regulator [Pantoea sp. VH_25]|nr:LexA family transcriptional regulator [Pantoea sp. VH_25]